MKSNEQRLAQLTYTLAVVFEEGDYPQCARIAESMKTVTKSKGIHRALDKIISAEGRCPPHYLWSY